MNSSTPACVTLSPKIKAAGSRFGDVSLAAILLRHLHQLTDCTQATTFYQLHPTLQFHTLQPRFVAHVHRRDLLEVRSLTYRARVNSFHRHLTEGSHLRPTAFTPSSSSWFAIGIFLNLSASCSHSFTGLLPRRDDRVLIIPSSSHSRDLKSTIR